MKTRVLNKVGNFEAKGREERDKGRGGGQEREDEGVGGNVWFLVGRQTKEEGDREGGPER